MKGRQKVVQSGGMCFGGWMAPAPREVRTSTRKGSPLQLEQNVTAAPQRGPCDRPPGAAFISGGASIALRCARYFPRGSSFGALTPHLLSRGCRPPPRRLMSPAGTRRHNLSAWGAATRARASFTREMRIPGQSFRRHRAIMRTARSRARSRAASTPSLLRRV